MIFQDMYMKNFQVAHKIKITYEGNKKPLKTKKTKDSTNSKHRQREALMIF